MMRAIDHDHRGHGRGAAFDTVTLAHDERAIRRRLITLSGGGEVLVDFARTVTLGDGDVLVLEDGRVVEVLAARQPLYEIRGRDTGHLMDLCWHIGNRHLPCQIGTTEGVPDRLYIERDHVIRDMLEGLGASVSDADAPFSPLRGAYAGHSHSHGHEHGHDHSHGHG